MASRFRRVADLFVEGKECFLGMDDSGEPVVIWVNKPNSFESEDARQDGAVARGTAYADLLKDDNPQHVSIRAQIGAWSHERLAEERVAQQRDQLTLLGYDDAQVENRELMDRVARGPALLDDEDVASDDPRREALIADQAKWFQVVRDSQQKRADNALRDAQDLDREDLEKEYLAAWRDQTSLGAFLNARRITELYFSLRDCRATRREDDAERWDHSKCDHSQRLCASRSEIRTLGDVVLDRVVETLDGLMVSARDSGNSDAPGSSSASSEQPNEPEDSEPSIPEVSSPAAPTT